MSKLCSAPYVGIQVDTDKTVRPCCMAKAYTDDQGSPLKFGPGFDWKKLKENKSYQRITQSLDNGKYPPECKACVSDPTPYAHTYLKRYDVEKYSKDPELQYMDLRLSNLCNLKCRMCWPGASNQIQKDYNNWSKVDTGHKWMNDHFRYRTFEEDKRYIVHDPKTILKQFPWEHLKTLALYGGEPLLIKDYEVVMDYLIENDLSKNITFKMHTNCTKWTPEFQNKINKFKETVVYFSMEGVGRINDYIRYPSKWATLERNFRNYLENKLPATGWFGISIALTPITLYYLHEVVDWLDNICQQHKIKRIDLRPSWCFYPYPQLANVLTDQQRDKIVTQLDNEKARYYINGLDSYIDKIKKVQYKPEMAKNFQQIYAFFDKERNQDGQKSAPEFFKELEQNVL
jgi:hypothetical protein